MKMARTSGAAQRAAVSICAYFVVCLSLLCVFVFELFGHSNYTGSTCGPFRPKVKMARTSGAAQLAAVSYFIFVFFISNIYMCVCVCVCVKVVVTRTQPKVCL